MAQTLSQPLTHSSACAHAPSDCRARHVAWVISVSRCLAATFASTVADAVSTVTCAETKNEVRDCSSATRQQGHLPAIARPCSAQTVPATPGTFGSVPVVPGEAPTPIVTTRAASHLQRPLSNVALGVPHSIKFCFHSEATCGLRQTAENPTS